MPTWHSTLHALDLPAGALSLALCCWIAAMMVQFVTHYRTQAEAVGGAKWPRLWWWVSGVFLLFGALLLIDPATRLWPELCVVGTVIRLISAPVLVVTWVFFRVGTRDGRTMYAGRGEQERLENLIFAVGQRVLKQAEAQTEPHGPG